MPQIDLTAALGRAGAHQALWSATLASSVAQTVAGTHGLAVDWDGDAGERWLRLVVAGGGPVAYVATDLPFALVPPGRGPWPQPVEVVEVADLDDTLLSCPLGVLARAFGDPERYRMLDPAGFTAGQLWYATV